MRQRSARKVTPNALGWLGRCQTVAWVGFLALLVQVFVPPTHDAHDISEAFAKAGRETHAPAEWVHLALAALERHQHGSTEQASAHEHEDADHHAPPGGHHHHSDDQSGCPVWQAAQGASNFVAPLLPVLQVPALPAVEPQLIQTDSARADDSFLRPQSRAPPCDI